MKKIIYSLVMVIAAGSLFTSCVTNTEPQGIKDIREAKANYLDALAELRKADAELVKAQAAFQDAKTALKNAETALKQADVKAKEIANSIADAKAKAEIEGVIAQAKIDAVKAEKDLADAEYKLQKALRDIAVNSQKLTGDESKAVKDYTDAYAKYIEKVEAVRDAEREVYEAYNGTAFGGSNFKDKKTALKYDGLKAAVTEIQKDSAEALAKRTLFEGLLKSLPDSGSSAEQMKEEMLSYQTQKNQLDYDLANLEKEWNLYQSTEVNGKISGFANSLVDWIINNASLPAPFSMHKKVQLPDNDQLYKYLVRFIGGSNQNDPLIDGVYVEEDNNGNYWLIANFNAAPQARRSIWGDAEGTNVRSIANVIEALSREFVVDSTKFGFDATGMEEAVEAAEEEYAEIQEVLEAKVMAYEGVQDAIEAAKEAEADSLAKKTAFDNAFTALWDAWDAIYKESEKEDADFAEKGLSGKFESAVVAYAKARKDYFGSQCQGVYYGSSYGNPGNDTLSLDDMIIYTGTDGETGKVLKQTKHIVDLTSDDFSPKQVEGKYRSRFESPADDATTVNSYNAALLNGYQSVLQWLFPGLSESGKTIMKRGTDYLEGNYPTDFVFFNTKGKQYSYEKVSDKKWDFVTGETKATLTKGVAAAWEEVAVAKADFYENVYCKFWGLDYEKLVKDEKIVATSKDVYFENPDKDSLRINFSLETFTEEYPFRDIIAPATPYAYKSEDSTFYYNGKLVDETVVAFVSNDQLDKIIKKILSENQAAEYKVSFGQLLIAKVLYKKAVLNTYSVGTQGTAESLAALQDICDELIEEYWVREAEQSAGCADFYKFFEEFIGKTTMKAVLAGLDSALTTAAQYLPARVEGGYGWSPWYSIVEKVASGEYTAESALKDIFENFMCGEYIEDVATKASVGYTAANINLPVIFKKIFPTKADTEAFRRYEQVYAAIQIGGAFSADAFKTLLNDVITNYIKGAGIDIYGWDQCLAEMVKSDNPIEKVLFGTQRAIDFAFDTQRKIEEKDKQPETGESVEVSEKEVAQYAKLQTLQIPAFTFGEGSHMVLSALSIIAPHVVKYFYTSEVFDGIVSTLEREYFSEWAEKWHEYDVARNTLETEKAALNQAKEIFEKYYTGIWGLVMTAEWFKDKIEDAKEAYEVACAQLAQIAEGVDPYTIAYEKAKNKLEAAKVALEAAEAKLAAAEAAYQQVLKNHGLAE